MALLLKWILNLFKRITSKNRQVKQTIQQANTSSDIILSSNSTDILSNIREVKDQAYFHRKNHLVNEFGYTPIPVYRGPQDKTPMGWLDANGKVIYNKDHDGEPKIEIHKGYVIQFFNSAELDKKREILDYKLHHSLPITSFLTEEEYKILKENNKMGDVLLANDVELLKTDPNYAKPNLEEKPSTTYVIGIDPYRQELLEEGMEQLLQTEANLKAKTGIPIDDPDQAEMKNDFEVALDKCRDESLLKETKEYVNKDKEPNINQIP